MSDEGVKLWVNNQLIIDHWTVHTAASELTDSGQTIAQRNYSVSTGKSTPTYLHGDQLGNASLIISSTSASSGTYEFDPETRQGQVASYDRHAN